MTEIDPNTKVTATSETVSTEVEGERVLLNLETGMYHGMNAVGAKIYSAIDEPTSVKEISREISNQYNVEREQVATDIQNFLNSLLEAGLAEVYSDASSS